MEMPAGNGTGTARSVAKLYGSAATGGSEIGVTPSTLDALKKPATSAHDRAASAQVCRTPVVLPAPRLNFGPLALVS